MSIDVIGKKVLQDLPSIASFVALPRGAEGGMIANLTYAQTSVGDLVRC